MWRFLMKLPPAEEFYRDRADALEQFPAQLLCTADIDQPRKSKNKDSARAFTASIDTFTN